MQKAMKYLLIKLKLVGYYNPAYKGYKAFNFYAELVGWKLPLTA